MRLVLLVLLSLFPLIDIPLQAEEYSILDKTVFITLQPKSQKYNIGYSNIIYNSEEVSYEKTILEKGVDYEIDYVNGILTFIEQISTTKRIKISFKVFPKSLLRSFQKYVMQDKIISPKISSATQSQSESKYESPSNLTITGSKSFAISLGNQQDMDLDQSLYLQVDGELTKNLFLKAQLSDNTTPISIEGTTKRLSEFDKMFIKVYSADYYLQFGDFFTKFTDTYYANYDFKLEGVTGHWQDNQKLQAAAAVSNGDFYSYSFYGTEGIQGPYYLPGRTSSQVTVLAGTDRLYLDGSLLKRGEDYFIDYNEGAVTFSNKLIITEDSYIIADYEYTAEEYRSNFYLAAGDLSLFNEELNISMKFISNNDDKNNPLNFVLTEEYKEVLRQAGDDPYKARVSGVDSVMVGQGNYILVDSHYVYVGFDSTGNYLVSFTYVGKNNGSYNKSGYVQYEWVGEGNGEYIPAIQLPFPENRMNFDVKAAYKTDRLKFTSEGMLSNYDRNSFSSIVTTINNGFAHYHTLAYMIPMFMKGDVQTEVFFRNHDKFFHSLARIESAETQYRTSDFIETDTVAVTEYGGNVRIQIPAFIRNRTSLSDKTMKGIARQQNISNTFSYFQNENINFLPSFNYQFSRIREEYEKSQSSEQSISTQRIHKLDGNFKIEFINLKGGYSDRKFKNDGPLNFGFSRIGYNYGVSVDITDISADFEYQREFIDSLKTVWFDYKKAQLWKVNLSYAKNKTNLSINYSHRKNHYTTEEKNTKFDLLDSRFSFGLFDNIVSNRLNYKVGNLELYPKVRELIFVGYGNGLYDSLGFYQEDGDYDYVVTIIGNPQPITDLQMNWHVNVNPGRGIDEVTTALQRFLKSITFTSDVVIKEKSTTPHKLDLYLLKPSALFNKKYTDYGYQRYKEQLWYNIIRNKLSVRLLYEKTKKIDNQYENEFDELDKDDYSAILNIYNVRKWNFENEAGYTDIISNYQTADFLHSKVYGFSTDVAYKFSYNMIFSTLLGIDIENGAKLDGTDEYEITSYTVAPEFVYNAGSKYHLMLQLNLQENKRDGSDYFANVLYSKRNGLSTRMTVQFDYKFSKYVTGFLKYYLEKFPKADARYQLKMEVRADF